jgi:RND superfamily putative drug exporter
MAWHLYRLGRWSFRHRRVVVALWVGFLVLGGIGAGTLSAKTSDTFELPGIESVEAFDLIKERTPDAAPDGATARIVFQAPEGQTLTSAVNKGLVLDTLAATETENVVSTTDPFAAGTLSEDERTGYGTVAYALPAIELTDADQEALESAPEEARADGLLVAIGGDALQEMPHSSTAELIGIGVALVVLVITFGSLLAAGMPLLTALIGVAVGLGGIQIATGFITLGSSTPTLATMLGLAVGIDYALFIVSRYRHEVAIGRTHEEAAGRAVGTAGSAVIFAGLTVVIALVGLSVVNISFLTQMGVAAAATVVVAVIIALTLLPALFGFAGSKILSGKLPFLKARDPEEHANRRTNGRRWADLVTHHKAAALAAGVVIALVVGGPIASMQLALPDDGTAAQGSDSRVSFDLISEEFGPGANGPLLVVVDTADATDPRGAVEATVERVSTIEDGVERVVSPIPDPGDAAAATSFTDSLATNRYALITVVPTTGPSDHETQQLVHDMRDAVSDVEDATGAAVLVSGSTAVGVDISDKLAEAFPRYLALVVGLAFLLLLAIFRSVLVPLKAVLGFLVTICVALGATVAVFQWGWFGDVSGVDTPGPVLFMLPLLLTGILFGLSMDYELFLVSRMREEYVHGASAKEAVVLGFQYGARVVTAAAAIMIGVFAGFALGDDIMIKSIGFALAVGILADAFLVRMTLVPAVMALMGDKAWWLPAWLDRLLPNLDIEGESLAARLDAETEESREDELAPA